MGLGCASTEFGDTYLHTQHQDPEKSRSCASCDVVNRSHNQTPNKGPVSAKLVRERDSSEQEL